MTINWNQNLLLCCGLFFGVIVVGCSQPQFIQEQIAPDIFGLTFPTDDPESTDVLLMLVGGSGFHPKYEDFATVFSGKGYNVVIIDYYGGGDDWGGSGIDTPETLEGYHQNVRDGIQWIMNDSGFKVENLYILGFSYGATIGINVAAEQDDVTAVVDFYGDLNMGIHDDQPPTEFIPDLPPLLLIYGDDDRVVSSDEAAEMMALLTQYDIPHQEYIIPGAQHGFATDDAYTDTIPEYLEIAHEWFQEHRR